MKNAFVVALVASVFFSAGLRSHSQELGALPPPAVSGALPVAITGQPFGVLLAEVPLPAGFGDREPRVLVEDSQGRVFYSVVSTRTAEVLVEQPIPRPAPALRIGRRGGLIDRVRSAIRGAPQKKQVPVALRVAALFRGNEPITLELVGDINQRILLTPHDASEAAFQALKTEWWQRYVDSAKQAISGDDAPKLIHKYLTTMLADRMELPRVDLDPPDPDKEELAQPLKTLALLAAIEPLREEILEDVISYPGDLSGAELPLPQEPVWAPTALPPLAGEVELEPLASRVPPECFYLRFGSFANYVWFQELSKRYGGDIGQAVLLRGFNYETSARMERMLASKMTTIGKMFGDKLINDMAIIGSDLYMKEGASLGVLFYASNPKLLNASIQSDRRAAVGKTPGATLQDVMIAGRKVSLLSTPDNSVRAFHVDDGDFIFVTTSETLARRFIEVGGGDLSLAATPAFQWARTWMPNANDYSVFAYFSPDFFHHLVSPQYQIELRRRLEAIAHIEVVELASQVATAESAAAEDTESLQAAGLLPPWFDVRPDGSRVLRDGQQWVDATRGARGSFLPIADTKIDSVTAREAEGYANIARFYQEKWQHMDPMLVGLRRFRAEGSEAEQVVFEGYIAPFEAEKYGWIANQLAAPSPIEIQLPANDAASVQLHMRGNSGLLSAPEDYHLFAGVKDMLPPEPEDTKGLLKTVRALSAAPAYIGAWPKPELIDLLPFGLGLAQPDYAGFSRMIGGLWRWQNNEFSMLSFNRSILDNAIPYLMPQETNDLAQARVRVANLQGSKLAVWVNKNWYERGWRASHGNAAFLDDVHQQLKVPSDECLDVAQRLLDVKLQCPLGGEFVFEPLPVGKGGWWQSTAWQAANWDARGKPIPPADYSAPWIDWFRGAKAHLTQQPDSLAVVGTIELEMQPLQVEQAPGQEAAVLPPMNFDLFNLPMQLFGGAEKTPKVERKSF